MIRKRQEFKRAVASLHCAYKYRISGIAADVFNRKTRKNPFMSEKSRFRYISAWYKVVFGNDPATLSETVMLEGIMALAAISVCNVVILPHPEPVRAFRLFFAV